MTILRLESRPVVLLDVDGVLADFVTGVVETAEQKLGLKLTPRGSFDIFPADDAGRELRRQVWPLVQTPGWARRLPLLPGARKAFLQLDRLARVYFVTSPLFGSPTWADDRRWWLENVLLSPTAGKRIVSTEAKYMVWGDVLVDDRVTHVANWSTVHTLGWGALWSSPYQSDPGKMPGNAEVVTNWDRVLEKVVEIAGR